MPMIMVTGIPKDIPQEALKSLRVDLQKAVVSVKKLNLTQQQVTVRFVPEICEPSHCELIAIVHGLYDKVERTKKVRGRLAEIIAITLKAFAKSQEQKSAAIEVFVDPPFRTEFGFYQIT